MFQIRSQNTFHIYTITMQLKINRDVSHLNIIYIFFIFTMSITIFFNWVKTQIKILTNMTFIDIKIFFLKIYITKLWDLTQCR